MSEELLRRALAECTGPVQREWVHLMATPDGFRGTFSGRYRANTYRRFHALRERMARAGIRTVEKPLGPRGRRRWVLDPEPLTELELACWRVWPGDAERAHSLAVGAGFTRALEIEAAVSYAGSGIGDWHSERVAQVVADVLAPVPFAQRPSMAASPDACPGIV